MPRYGAAIDMKNFGDRFYGGFITKEYGEQPIHFLQGRYAWYFICVHVNNICITIRCDADVNIEDPYGKHRENINYVKNLRNYLPEFVENSFLTSRIGVHKTIN